MGFPKISVGNGLEIKEMRWILCLKLKELFQRLRDLQKDLRLVSVK